jgi:hypothetical protein
MTTKSPLLIASLLAFSSACAEKIVVGEGYELSDVENEGESLDPSSDEEEEDGDSDNEEEEEEEEEAPLDVRTFAMKLRVSTLMPGIWNPDNLEEVRTTSYLRVDWIRDGAEVMWTEELCDINSTEAHGAQTSFPRAFISSMPQRDRFASLSEAEVGATFETETYLSLDGVELDEAWTDTLPTSSGDPRIFDQDSDGHAGITIHVDAGIVAGDIYVVQRSQYQMTGLVVAQDRIEAYIDYDADQSILGASNGVLTMVEVEPQRNPDSTASYVIFQQVDDDTTCSDIKAAGESLF